MGLRTMKRRRNENKTDYKLRLSLLKSGIPRIVVRKTNKYFILQVVESNEAQDRIIMSVNSKELLKNGWNEKLKGSLKSIPAGYLAGFLLAKRIKEKKMKKKKFIIDLGMARTLHGSRVFSVVKGLKDGGLNFSFDEKASPSRERLNGEHLKPELKNIVEKIKSKLIK